MSAAIPVKIKSMPDGNTIGAGVHALGHEILSHLERFNASGETAAIDLKSLPMAPGEFEQIKEMLGQGEIDLTLDMDGPSRFRETAYPGVWWVQHKDGGDRILSEYIEITRIPDFLATQPDQFIESADRLRDRLKGAHQ